MGERWRGSFVWLWRGFGVGLAWVRLELAAGLPAERSVLITKSAWVDSHQIFVFDAAGQLLVRAATGDRIQNSGPLWRFLYPVVLLPPNSRVVLVRYESRGSIVAPLQVLPYHLMLARLAEEYRIQAGIFAVLLLVALLGFGSFLLTGLRAMAQFSLQMLAFSYVHLVLSGLAQDFLMPYAPYALNEGLLIASAVAAASSLAFVRSFLELGTTLPRADRVLQTGQWAFGLAAAVAALPGVYSRLAPVISYASALIAVVPFFCGMNLALRRVSGSLTVGLGAGLALIGLAVESLSTGGHIPQSFLGLMGVRLGLVAQGLWLWVGLGLRLRAVSAAKVRAQADLKSVDDELEQAARIHGRLLPDSMPQMTGATIRVRHRPASRIGGDFYFFHKFSDSDLFLFLADVTGHGLPAALDSSLIRVALRNALAHSGDPGQVLAGMSHFLAEHMDGRFASAICARLDTAGRRVRVASAGHPQALLVEPGGGTVIESEGPLLGLEPGLQLTEVSAQVPLGAYLIFYTDGLVESSEDDQELLMDEAMLSICPLNPVVSADELADAIFLSAPALQGRGPAPDDVTFILTDLRK